MSTLLGLVLFALLFKFGCGDGSIEEPFSMLKSQVQFPRSSESNPSFKIGGLFSITNGGVNTSISEKGLQRAEAMKFAIDLINKDESLLPGVTLKYSIQDDGGLINLGLFKSLGYLVVADVIGIVGAASSSVTEPIARLASSFNLPVISYASSAASLSDRDKYPSLFRTASSDVSQTRAMLGLAKHFDWTLVSAIGTNDPYGLPGYQGFKAGSSDFGIKVVCGAVLDSPFTAAAIRKFSSCVKSSGITVIMLFMSDKDAAAFISRLMTDYESLVMTSATSSADDTFGVQVTVSMGNSSRSSSIDRLFTFIASDSWGAGSNTVSVGKTVASGWSNEWIKGTIGTVQSPGNLKPLQQYLNNMSPETTSDYPFFRTWWEKQFICKLQQPQLPICSFNEPISSRKKSPCTCNGLENLKDIIDANPKGNLIIDAVYVFAHALHKILFQCESLAASLPKLCNSTTFGYSDLLTAISTISFQGQSGDIGFNGVDRVSSSYDYYQFDGSEWKPVGTYSETYSEDPKGENEDFASFWDENSLVWNTKTKPISKMIPDIVDFDDASSITVITLVSLNIIVALIFIITFYRNAEMPVIKRSSPLFCIMILVGLIMIWASLIFWGGNQTRATCNFKVWLGLLGYVMVMSNMLVKTWRIWKIFDTSKLRARAIHNYDLLVGSFVMVGFEVILLGIWSIYDAPQPILKESSISEFYQYQECQGSNPMFQTVWSAIVLGLNASLVVAGSVLAFLTRNVTSSFNESKYIALCMYNLTVCLVILVPVYLSTIDSEGYAARLYVIRSLAILFPSSFTMFALFGPKIYRLIFLGGSGSQNDLRTNMGPGFLGGGGAGLNAAAAMAYKSGAKGTTQNQIKEPAKLKDSASAYTGMKIMKMAQQQKQTPSSTMQQSSKLSMPEKASILAESMDSTIMRAVLGAGYGPSQSPSLPKKVSNAAIVNTQSVEDFPANANINYNNNNATSTIFSQHTTPSIPKIPEDPEDQ